MDSTNLLDELDNEQRVLLREFRTRFASHDEEFLQDDNYLVHWLKARRFDVDKSEEMLRQHLRFRHALNMDSAEFRKYKINPVMADYYTRGQIGYDKQGRPVVYFPFGGIDPKGILSSVRVSEAVKTMLFWMEERQWCIQEASKKFNKQIDQVIYIIDLKGIGTKHMWKPGIEVFKQLSQAVQNHSPEIIYKLFIVNAPNLFYTIYKLIKPVLDENTQRKIDIYGEEFKQALLKHIDADQLPVYYGGNLIGERGDERCRHAIKYGGDVPEEMYFRDNVSPPDHRLINLTVYRGSQTLIPVDVMKPNSRLSWYFKNDSSNDIGFAIYRQLHKDQTNLEDMKMLMPYARLLTNLVPEYGDMTLKEAGTYIFQFDNQYSWLQNKYIKYLIEVDH